MKLAVFSDVHGNLTALQTVLAAIDAAAPDEIWMLGDLAANGARPNDCITVIRERHTADEKRFRVIGGNTDRYLIHNARPTVFQPLKEETDWGRLQIEYQFLDASLAWARSQLTWENVEFLTKIVHRELEREVDGYGVVMGYHAIPGDDEVNIKPDSPNEAVLDSVLDRTGRLGIYGHTHIQMNRQVGRIHLVNPGAVSMSFDNPSHAQYGLFTFEGGDVQVELFNLPYDVDAEVAVLEANKFPYPSFIENVMRKGSPF